MSTIIIPEVIGAQKHPAVAEVAEREGYGSDDGRQPPAVGRAVTLVRSDVGLTKRFGVWALLAAVLASLVSGWVTLGRRHIPAGAVGLMQFTDHAEVYPSGTFLLTPWSPEPQLLDIGSQVSTVELGGMVVDREGLPVPSLTIEVVHRFDPAFAQRLLAAGAAGGEAVRIRVKSAATAAMVEILSELTSIELARIGFRLSPLLDERVRTLIEAAWPSDLRDGIIVEHVSLTELAVDAEVQHALMESSRKQALTALLEGAP
ncbi:hypothetical protein JN531_016945 (plasmid) [Flagellatimonas centrodinii]|uniref:hypothetical protein n=1 Tax=Flagellatimonas centrodinii TaxID=2806210 RepID=UPI001FFA97D5|nr:hypothetical protein [Flagellatimonas centrodinii]ULQ48320.1 hypothetical protein JN531_016945 [Flagellatimonas centrodinii]